MGIGVWGRSLVLTGMLTCCAGVVCGQPAAPAPPPPPKEPPPRLEMNAHLTLLNTTGNTRSESFGAGGEVIYRPLPWLYKARFDFLQNEDDDVLAARSFVGLFRLERQFSPRLSAFGQYDFLRDTFSGIEQRHTAAGGLTYALIDHPPHRLEVDGGFGYQYEERLDAENTSSAVALAGTYYRWDINANNQLTDAFRITLPLAETSQWKIDHVVALVAKLTSILSLRVSHTIRFSNEPVPGFESTDTITAIAFVVGAKKPGP